MTWTMTWMMTMMLLLLKELCHISLPSPHSLLCVGPQGAKLLCTLQNFILQNCQTALHTAKLHTAKLLYTLVCTLQNCTEAKLLCTLLCSASHFIAVGLKLLARVQHSALVFAMLQWSIADCSFVWFWTVCTCAVCSVQCSAREGKGMCNAVQCNAVQGKGVCVPGIAGGHTLATTSTGQREELPRGWLQIMMMMQRRQG